MLKLSKLADYAVVLLTQITRRQNAITTTARLCEDTGLPQPTVSKVLKILARGGLLNAQRGALGGYVLARPARSISIADVVTVMCGPVQIVECTDDSATPCSLRLRCPIQGRWNRVNQAIRAALQGVSLEDLAKDKAACAPAMEKRAAAEK